jgi:transposase InsO family protein
VAGRIGRPPAAASWAASWSVCCGPRRGGPAAPAGRSVAAGRPGVRIQRVLTDNAKAYAESVVFAETAAGLGIRLKRTRPYRPQTNGKVERFNKTLLEEWAYARLYRSNDERRRAFTRWLRIYNHRRPHTSLDGLTPMAVLVNNVHGKHS